MFINCRATNNKKVPSFGSSSGSQTEPELGDASSSASAVTQTDETEKDDGIQTDKIGSTDEAEDAFLRDVIKDLCRGDREDIRVSETNEGVSQEKAFVKNIRSRGKHIMSRQKFKRSSKALLLCHFVSVLKKLQRGRSYYV